MKLAADLYGTALLEALSGEATPLHLRAGDGRLTELGRGRDLLEPPESPASRDWLALVHGRTLDLGAGSGWASLRLQERGLEVIAVDVSPGACECMRRRGVRQVVHSSWQALSLGPEPGFDAVLLLGSGVGLAGSALGLQRLLTAVATWLVPGGRALVTSVCPVRGSAGAVVSRMRLESGFRVSPWFEWLEVAPSYLGRAAAGAGLTPQGRLEAEPGLEFACVLVRDQDPEEMNCTRNLPG